MTVNAIARRLLGESGDRRRYAQLFDSNWGSNDAVFVYAPVPYSPAMDWAAVIDAAVDEVAEMDMFIDDTLPEIRRQVVADMGAVGAWIITADVKRVLDVVSEDDWDGIATHLLMKACQTLAERTIDITP